MKNIFLILIGLFYIANLQAQTPKADQILGDWISPDKDLIVRCYKENNHYFGKVIWFKKYNNDARIDAIDDSKGIPESKWLNTIVMNKFVFDKDEWTDGTIFQLKTGKSYSAFVKMKNENTLRLTGYILLPIFSESVTFTRYQDFKKNLLSGDSNTKTR
jgi:uncharacterized protein (DUF2147 family)|nr:DUF2147 domain-containing protein [uncultured Emticicia sp.]